MEVPLKGISSLPEHLFVDILALLQSQEIAQAARVCRRWNSVASTPYLWCHLSFISSDTDRSGKYAFTAERLSKEDEMPWRKIVELSQGRTVSVELAFLSHSNISKLAVALKMASSSLKHITWSVSPEWGGYVHKATVKVAARKVLELAQACPQLASLEVMCPHALSSDLFSGGFLRTGKLQRFRTNTPVTSELYAPLSAMLLHAKVVSTVSMRRDWPEESTRIEERWLLHLLSSNTALEALRASAFVDSNEEASSSGVVTSLSLQSLELLSPWWVFESGVRLHAPNVRRLAAEVRILGKLSLETTSNLSELHLQLHRPRQNEPQGAVPGERPLGPRDTDGLQRVKGHTGAMTLDFGSTSTEHAVAVMQDLEPYLASPEVVWPGLTEVRLYLAGAHLTGMLRRFIAARTAGARGASREQYEAIVSGTATQTGMTFIGPPLCKEVVWRFQVNALVSSETIASFEQLHNVHFYQL